MGRASIGTVRTWILIAATLALGCVALTPVRADDCKRVQNILVLFDASGYMKEKDRYDEILKNMKLFQRAMPVTADGFFNVGLRHYGLKVGLQCNSTESILPIEPWDPERFIYAFPDTVSYGSSALSAGLRAAAREVASAEGKGIIILIGGGIDSCDTDPIKIADRLAFNYPDLEIHTFQVGNSQEGKYNLESIANKARGSFTRLLNVRNPALWHGWMKRWLVVPCQQTAPTQEAAMQEAVEFGPILFDYNSFIIRSKDPAIDAANRANLAKVAEFIQDNPQAKVVLHGYTDGKGDPAYNRKLSKRRADAVARQLRANFGIPSTRLAVLAHGESRPGIPPNEARRVEFEVFR